MANCPKCNHKLRVIDWKPECPNCGVNVVYYDFEERFYIDAKGAELDAARIRVKWTRIKAAFVGSKLIVARLALCVLPLVATLLSFGTLTIAFPLFEKRVPFSLLGLFAFFTDGTFSFLTAVKSSEIVGVFAKHAVNIFFGVAATVAVALLVFALELLCFISIKKMTMLLTVASGLGILAAGWSMAAVYFYAGATQSTVFIVANGFGGFVVLAMFAAVLAVNALIVKKGVPLRYKEGDLYRVDIARKLKRKEITLDELEQPVYRPAGEQSLPEDTQQGGERDG